MSVKRFGTLEANVLALKSSSLDICKKREAREIAGLQSVKNDQTFSTDNVWLSVTLSTEYACRQAEKSF